MVKKYGLPMLVTSDEGLKEYIQTILAQVSGECGLADLHYQVLTLSSQLYMPQHIANCRHSPHDSHAILDSA